MSNLKPCPFCGMNYAENAWDDYGSEYWVCEFCGAASGTERDEYSWNIRPIEDDLRKRIAELEEKQRWIPVGERLPEDGVAVLVAFTENPKDIDILTAKYYKHYAGFGGLDNWWNIEGWHTGNVTHWMPLPESPNYTQTQAIVYGKECK